MQEIGMVEAKTHLAEIAQQVRQTGQPVTLTDRGEPFVDIVPHRASRRRSSKAEISAALAELQRELPQITREGIRSSIDEGRR